MFGPLKYKGGWASWQIRKAKSLLIRSALLHNEHVASSKGTLPSGCASGDG